MGDSSRASLLQRSLPLVGGWVLGDSVALAQCVCVA